MYITIDNKKYEQLKMIASLAAQQLFFQQDYIQLAQAIQANSQTDEQMKHIIDNFPNFMATNNALVKLLMDVKVLATQKEVEEITTSTEIEDPTPPEPPKTPTFKIVK